MLAAEALRAIGPAKTKREAEKNVVAAVDGRCDVLVSGITPQARFWTLTLYDPDGRLVANSVRRQGFTSQEIIRKADGSFEIRLTTIGKHTIVVTPVDVKFPVPPGQVDYPCDRSPSERDVQAGMNKMTIELADHKK